MRKLKIFHLITNSCPHPYLSGLLQSLQRDQFELFAGSLDPKGQFHEDVEKLVVESLSLDARRRVEYAGAVLKLARWLKQRRIDIIQTHLLDATAVGMIAAKFAGVPIKIVTAHHSHEMPYYRGRLIYYMNWMVDRYLADAIVAPSESMKSILSSGEKIPENRIHVINHGVERTINGRSISGRKRIRREFGIGDRTIFGAVGKIFWIKDYENLIRAFAKSIPAIGDAILMVVGSGDQTKLRDLALKLGIDDRVIFPGFRWDIDEILSAFDVFVHSSLAESFGLVIIEAMAKELPVVSTRVGISNELITSGENGRLVKPGDIEELSAAIISIYEDRLRWGAIGQRNRELIAKFSMEKMGAEHGILYDLMGKKMSSI